MRARQYTLKGKGTETHGGTDRCQSSEYMFPLKMNHMIIDNEAI